ncbi:NAD-dependent epimerase/dehydratase family protein [Thermococcus sp.]
MILVFGGTGFVGSFVSSYLSKYYDVVLAVRNPEKARDLGLNHVHFTSLKEIPAIVERVNPDVIVNFIGVLRGDYWTAHVRIPELIAVGAKKTGSRVIHTSALGADENSQVPYFRTKALGEKIIGEIENHAIVRPSLILGPGQRLFHTVKFVFPDLKSRVQPIDLRDLAKAYESIIKRDLDGTFSLCGDERVELGKLVRTVFEKANRMVFLLPIPGLVLKTIGKFEPSLLMALQDNVCVKNDSLKLVEKLTPLEESINWTAGGL